LRLQASPPRHTEPDRLEADQFRSPLAQAADGCASCAIGAGASWRHLVASNAPIAVEVHAVEALEHPLKLLAAAARPFDADSAAIRSCASGQAQRFPFHENQRRVGRARSTAAREPILNVLLMSGSSRSRPPPRFPADGAQHIEQTRRELQLAIRWLTEQSKCKTLQRAGAEPQYLWPKARGPRAGSALPTKLTSPEQSAPLVAEDIPTDELIEATSERAPLPTSP